METNQDKAEDKIIDWIALGSDGRLVAVKPEKGADLAVQKKGDYPGKELLFILKIFEKPWADGNFNIEVAEPELQNKENFYLIFAVFDEIKQKVEEKIWLVPILEFLKTAEKKEGKPLFDSVWFEKYAVDKNGFNLFLIDKLISQNKEKLKAGFKPKVY